MTRRMLALLVTAVAAAAAGYWWGRTHDGDPGLTAVAPATSSRKSFATKDDSAPHLSAEAAREQRALQYRDLGGVDELRTLPSEFARREALHVVAGRADGQQLRKLINEAIALPDERERLDTLETLWLRYAEFDPEAALRSALETDRATATRLIAALAQAEPEAAWEAVARISDPMSRLEYQNAVVATWATQDPERAFASVKALPATWPRQQLLREATSQIAQRDAALALELLNGVDPAEQTALRSVVAEEWVRYDPEGVARWIENSQRGNQGQLAYQIASAYLAQRQDEALAWALRIARTPGKNLWSQMVGEIARHNPEEAWRLAQAAENPAQRTRASGEVLKTVAARDPALAMLYLQKLPAGRVRTQIAAQVAGEIAYAAPSAAMDWLDNMDDEKARIAVAGEMAYSFAQRDVEAATRLMDRVPKEARYQWAQAIAMAYATQDPEKGVEWLGKYRDMPGDAAFIFTQNVAVNDADAAVEIIERFSDKKQRTQALQGALSMLAEQAPQTAARLIDDMNDAQAKERMTGQVAGAWARYDEAAARKWVQSMPWGRARDNGLSSLVAATPSLDERLALIGQIQSPDQRMSTVWNTAVRMANNDPEGMRTLLRRYPLDPQRQAQLDSALRKRGYNE